MDILKRIFYIIYNMVVIGMYIVGGIPFLLIVFLLYCIGGVVYFILTGNAITKTNTIDNIIELIKTPFKLNCKMGFHDTSFNPAGVNTCMICGIGIIE